MLINAQLGARPPKLRELVSAGEPLNPEVIERVRAAWGLTIRDGYGQTETTAQVGNPPGRAVKPGSMGIPSPAFEVAVLDESLRRAPPGVEGEVAIRAEPRPPALFRGYWKDPERTAAVFRDGWYLTGDRARVDADGDFWFVGRADDVIKSSGYRIGPFEVESALLEHPAVVESAVVGVPDEVRGQIVKAFVVLGSDTAQRLQGGGAAAHDALVAELQHFVQERTAPYKYPREIEFERELPKTVSGKIRRIELRGRS
jgi:acyl-coenzyme A synthetase/AMP-(fatty) acid ligase